MKLPKIHFEITKRKTKKESDVWDVTDEYNIKLFVNKKLVKSSKRQTRLIYFWENLVIKFEPDGAYFYQQCLNEYEAWTNGIEKKDKKYFVPIYDYGSVMYKEDTPDEKFIGAYIIGPRLRFKNRFSENDINYSSDRLQTLIDKYDIKDVHFGSKRSTYNCGITTDGKFKIYDYGLLEAF